ncbi:MAG: 16S rRNA processing protein RimM [Lentimicrobiaceae bacterium]|nr:16S rRNA processing protein RimM [Lentimicrobiaceae bacterium]
MTKDTCFYVGKIVKTHGLKGEVTLRIDNEQFDEIGELNYFLLDINDKLIPYFVENITFHSNKSFVLFQDLKTLEAANQLVGISAYLPLDLLPEKDGNDFYSHEVVDFLVIDEEKGELGKVQEIIEYPTQSLIQIVINGKEVLIPIHDDIIQDVNREEKKIYIKAPNGLIDMYLEN